MKQLITLTLLPLLTLGSAQAALYDRGGGLIYDDVLNVIWLQDANANGVMTWADANAWAGNLTVGNTRTWTEASVWRLPSVGPINDTTFNYMASSAGDTDIGYNISASGTTYAGSTQSEMAYMFYNNLDGVGAEDTAGDSVSPYGLLSGTGPFTNLETSNYWSDQPQSFFNAMFFNFATGEQNVAITTNKLFAWAVRDGDVNDISAVPVPGAVWLFGSGLLGLLAFRRRQRSS
ncbi:MAG: PEP-CTERM sorting domain-containing protein [Sedimenticola sp.]